MERHPNGEQVGYGYDVFNKINKVEARIGGIWKKVLDADIRLGLKSVTFGSGLKEVHEYDQNDWLKVLGSKSYSPNLAGQIDGITNGANSAASQTYGYDAAARLDSVTSALGNQSILYDKNGNRKTHSWGGATDTYHYTPGSNRLASITDSRAKSFSYDNTAT